MEYIYLGDRYTDERFKKKECKAVRNSRGKCIRGKNSNMLVEFEGGLLVNVLARLLRKVKHNQGEDPERSVATEAK